MTALNQSATFDAAPRRTISSSISHQKQCQLDDQFIDRLDHTETLGGDDSSGNLVGHSGCVNALAWSPSGQLLASGSDDRNVILWKLGSAHLHPTANSSGPARQRSSLASRYGIGASRRSHRDQQSDVSGDQSVSERMSVPLTEVVDDNDNDIVERWLSRQYPKMDMGMLGKIETGHRANIFSVKWAPNASERRLFTCAGDSHVRVFDINYLSASTGHGAEGQVQRFAGGRECTVWSEHSGACVRLFRCHRGRAKRISTEVSPDVFLTCGEDGDVRQMDLRVPHTCRTRSGGSCPPPLAHYPSVLYSLSVSKVEPWLFAVAGESPFAHLHDRRMIPRLIKRDWGMTVKEEDALTMCVRSFGVPPGGFEAPWAQNDGRTALVSDAPPPSGRRLLMGNRNSVTACKLSEQNGRDLLVSYSSGHIYRFDIYDEPGILHANLDKVRFSLDTDDERSPSAARGGSHQKQEESKKEPESDEEMHSTSNPWRLHAQDDDDLADDIESAIAIEQSGSEAEENDSHQSTTNNDDDGVHEGEDSDDTDDDEDDDEADDGMDPDSDDEEEFLRVLQENAEAPPSSDPTMPTVYPRSAYKGHCNKETVKDVAFAGRGDEYVISGSDDGNWFMWDKLTSEIKGIWHGDSSVVNVMAMHPDLPVFAISGIDDTIKIFAPATLTESKPVPRDELKVADRMHQKETICDRNERQLDRDFITPAANVLWRLHPRLLGMEVDEDDPERQIEGDCTVM